MKIRRYITFFLAALLPFCFTAGSFAAATENSNTVTLSVEAFTVNYGFVLDPYTVTLGNDDNAGTLITKTLGADKINNGAEIGNYIRSIALESEFINVNDNIKATLDEKKITVSTQIAKNGWLSEFDFTSKSGWVLIVNNTIIKETISEYKPKAGDVIRLAFSVYGFGADLAVKPNDIAKEAETGIFKEANRDTLYKAMAAYYTNSDFDMDNKVESAATDVTAEQSEIDEAYGLLNGIVDDIEDPQSGEETEDDVEPDDEDENTEEDEEEDEEETEDTEPDETKETEKTNEPDFVESTGTELSELPEATTAPDIENVPNSSYDEYIMNIPKAESAPTGVETDIGGLAVVIAVCTITGLIGFKNKKYK